MQCYTELLPPSGVTHALSVPFISATSSNLVVAKTSLLQIFSVIDVISGENGKPEDKARRLDRPQNGKLVLVAEYALSGTVTDMSRVKILNSKSGGEAILIAFRNAKLSLIEWDPERHAISTISIHYYEKEDLTRSPWVPDLSSCGSHLTVDPTSRCAILNFGIRNLAIIPFHQPGDDLVMDDYDPSLDGEHDATETSETANKEQQSYQTPYGSSFVLPLTALEPSLLHPISLAFLYEYREPTFGILYSQVATSNALLHERKDAVFYAVFTLDLEQRASTTLLSVARLPSDLFKVVALPSPVGGALLIGTNELVHVDQAGKTNAVGVNEFSRQVSAFSMADQSDLALRLEGCHVEQLDMEKGDLILVLSTGDMILVSFKLDGRSVSGLSVRPISANGGGNILEAPPSCSATLSHNRIFFGSEDADSVLLGWSDTSAAKSRGHKRQGPDDAGETSDLDEDEDDYNYEDDLYSTAPSGSLQDATSGQDSSLSGSYNFRLNDKLPNLGPLRDIALGKSQKSHRANSDNDSSTSAELELVASHGSGRSSGLVVLKRELDPHVINSLELDHLDCLWSVTMNDHATAPNNEDARTENEVSRYVILSKIESSDKEESLVYALAGSKLEPFKAPEFNPNEDYTIDIGTLANGTRVVQVLKSEVRSYDANLGLAQIYPVWDEDTSDERVVVAASFADPYLVILRDDATLLILQTDASGDLDEVTLPEEINEARWLSCSLYKDTQSFFSLSASAENADSFLLFALNLDCKLFVGNPSIMHINLNWAL
ncbi:mRNA cleavage and polyadenylation factor subunit [Paecilomyces lecythidis]